MLRVFRQCHAVWLLSGLIMLLSGCAALSPRPDVALGRQQRQRAEQLIKGRQYQQAAEQLALAVKNLPLDGETTLRLGEVLEALGHDPAAAEAYRSALTNRATDANQLRYRLGLLQSLRLGQLNEAVFLQKEIQTGSFEALDLQGTILIRKGEPRQALILYAKLAKTTQDEGKMAHIAYHAALAYLDLKANDDAFGNLYQAINRASHLGLIHQIQNLWNQFQPDNNLPMGPKG